MQSLEKLLHLIFCRGGSLGKHKENILRERDRLNSEVEELNRRLQIQRTYTDETEKKRLESEKKLKEMYKLLDATSDEAFREKKMIELYKIQLTELTADRDNKEEVMRHYKSQVCLSSNLNYRSKL